MNTKLESDLKEILDLDKKAHELEFKLNNVKHLIDKKITYLFGRGNERATAYASYNGRLFIVGNDENKHTIIEELILNEIE